ncbi:hypothetical protein QOT17_021110 [Balamuthia mandrillaris]
MDHGELNAIGSEYPSLTLTYEWSFSNSVLVLIVLLSLLEEVWGCFCNFLSSLPSFFTSVTDSVGITLDHARLRLVPDCQRRKANNLCTLTRCPTLPLRKSIFTKRSSLTTTNLEAPEPLWFESFCTEWPIALRTCKLTEPLSTTARFPYLLHHIHHNHLASATHTPRV